MRSARAPASLFVESTRFERVSGAAKLQAGDRLVAPLLPVGTDIQFHGEE